MHTPAHTCKSLLALSAPNCSLCVRMCGYQLGDAHVCASAGGGQNHAPLLSTLFIEAGLSAEPRTLDDKRSLASWLTLGILSSPSGAGVTGRLPHPPSIYKVSGGSLMLIQLVP